MAGIVIRRAERKKAKLRLALIGPTGSGKSLSALMMAEGIGGKIGMIDTENGSGDLYADLLEYDIITLDAPYTVSKYREAIHAFEDAGCATIIIDSLSHAWAGQGGLLDKQGSLESSGRYKNSFATWREITPEQNRLMEDILACKCHVIATMRAKTEYVLDKDERGKTTPRKIGLSPVQRDGVEYEFTMVMDINDNHIAVASKDRTSLFDGWADKISPATGKRLLQWLESGADAQPPKPRPVEFGRASRAVLYFAKYGVDEARVLSTLGVASVHELTEANLKTLSEIKGALAGGAAVQDLFPLPAHDPETGEIHEPGAESSPAPEADSGSQAGEGTEVASASPAIPLGVPVEELAHKRGFDDFTRGVARRAVPPEYRGEGKTDLAAKWVDGWLEAQKESLLIAG